MDQSELKSFEQFWPYYVGEHSHPATRTLHAVGTIASTALVAAFVVRRTWRYLPLALIPGYAAAWVGHFLVEHNKPATFGHPVWSMAADYKMVGMMLAGKMDAEVARVLGEGDESQSMISGQASS